MQAPLAPKPSNARLITRYTDKGHNSIDAILVCNISSVNVDIEIRKRPI